MKLRLENQWGVITMAGGGTEEIRITAIEGMGLPTVTLDTVQYAGQEGRTTLSALRNYRTVTLAGDITGAQAARRVRELTRVLSWPVTVTVLFGGRERQCVARCTSFATTFGKGRLKTFTMQLECDSPYWQDPTPCEAAIYHRVNCMSGAHAAYFGSAKKPLSRLVQSNLVENRGDVPAEPVILIHNLGGTVTSGNGISVKNCTTGQAFTLHYQTKAGETVTVDIPHRRITNGAGESLLDTLSDDSYLSDFQLTEGSNLLQACSNGDGERLMISCRFYNQYLEAME